MSAEATAALEEGIRLCFNRWTALQLAVENEWGGRSSRQKVQKLQADVLTFFVHSRVQKYIDELEQLLDDNLIQLLNLEAEDESIQEVAEQLMVLHEECAQGNYETVLRLQAAASLSRPAVAGSQQVPNENGDDSDSDDDLTEGEDDSLPTPSGQQAMSMDVEPSGVQTRAASQRDPRVQTLTEEEMADGWQAAPTKGRRRGG